MAKTATATLPLPVAPTSPAPRAEPTRSASTVPTSTQPAAAPAQVALGGGADTMAQRILAALEKTAETQAAMTRIMAEAVQMQAETVKLLGAMRELAATTATSAPTPVAPAATLAPTRSITARDAQGRILPRTAAAPAPAPAAPAPKSVKQASTAATTPKSTTGGATKAREAMAELQALRTRLVAPGKITALDAIIAAVNAGQITDAQIAAADVSVEGIAGDVVAGVCAKITRIAKIK